MSEESANPTPAPEPERPAPETPAPDVPAKEPGAPPASEPVAAETASGDDTSASPDDQPRWYAKGRAKIPDKLFPSLIKADGVKAWTVSFIAVLVGLFFWLFMSFHGWAGVLTALAGIVGLYYALLAAKRTPGASRNLAVSIGMLALISFVFFIGGCKAHRIHAKADWGRLLEAQRTAEKTVDSMSEILKNNP